MSTGSGYGGTTGIVSRTKVNSIVNQGMTANVVETINWGGVIQNPDGWWSGAAIDRLTVPAGISYVDITANVLISSAVGRVLLMLYKNGAIFDGSPRDEKTADVGATNPGLNIHAQDISVNPGDYFSLHALASGNVSALTGEHTWFAIRGYR